MTHKVPFRWQSAATTDLGKVREINEDAYANCPEIGLWAVADGMGGHLAGDLASGTIVGALKRIEKPGKLSEFVDKVEDCLLDVNKRLVNQASSDGRSATIGSTVAILLAEQDHCVCLWAGDSRVYRLRDHKMQSITQDHSEVEEMIEQGQLLRENAEAHPAANVITRAVGAAEELFIDVELERLQDGDRYLLCSDGLYKEIAEEEICEYLQRGSCSDACRELIGAALQRGSRDNVTALVVDFEKIR
jgi:serine/threonine protein phosphatase PrpC